MVLPRTLIVGLAFLLAVIAQTDWTTRHLLDVTRDSLAQGRLQPGPYGLVTLMIGVNNQFQGLDARVWEVQAFNAILARKFGEYGIVMVDITPLSLLVENEPQLLARDGLHYSQEMYRRWVALMLPAVLTSLGL